MVMATAAPMQTEEQAITEREKYSPMDEIAPPPPAPDPPSSWALSGSPDEENIFRSNHAKVAEKVAKQFSKQEGKNEIEAEIAAIKSGQKQVYSSSTRDTAKAWSLAREKVDATKNEVAAAITKKMNIIGEKAFLNEKKSDIIGEDGNIIGEKVDLVGDVATIIDEGRKGITSSTVKFDSTAVSLKSAVGSGTVDVAGRASATIIEDGEVVGSAETTFGNTIPTATTAEVSNSAGPSTIQERGADGVSAVSETRDGNADEDIEISWNRATSAGVLDGELSLGSGLENMSGNLGMDASSSGIMAFGTVGNGSKAKVANKPSVLERTKTLVCKLPDPTLFFFLEVATVLTLNTVHPLWLRTIIGRVLTLLITLMTVGMASLWRGTQMKAVSPTKAIQNPVRPIPRASQIVHRGELLRAREAAVLKAEEELHMGQLKLRTMRQDIERRLPPAASISTMLKSDASVASDPLEKAAYQAKNVVASIPTAGSLATPAGAVGAARAPSSDPQSFKSA